MRRLGNKIILSHGIASNYLNKKEKNLEEKKKKRKKEKKGRKM